MVLSILTLHKPHLMHLKFANEEHQIVRINFPKEFTLVQGYTHR